MCFAPSFLRSRGGAVTRITKSSYCRNLVTHKTTVAFNSGNNRFELAARRAEKWICNNASGARRGAVMILPTEHAGIHAAWRAQHDPAPPDLLQRAFRPSRRRAAHEQCPPWLGTTWVRSKHRADRPHAGSTRLRPCLQRTHEGDGHGGIWMGLDLGGIRVGHGWDLTAICVVGHGWDLTAICVRSGRDLCGIWVGLGGGLGGIPGVQCAVRLSIFRIASALAAALARQVVW